MAEYGVTAAGYVPKRADEIKESINAKLKEGWGYDVSMNPQSMIQVLVTGISDEIAALWEEGQETYYSLYPSSAEGHSLDNVLQFAGLSREADQRTKYTLKCTGDDMTAIPYGTRVMSDTQPQKYFMAYTDGQEISHGAFREVLLSMYVGGERDYAISINGESVFYSAGEGEDPESIVDHFVSAIKMSGIEAVKEDGMLRLCDTGGASSNVLAMSENVLVEECVSNIIFESEEYGEVVIPNGLINKIYSNVAGFRSVVNDSAPILGRLEATDIETRQDYVKRSMVRSCNMVDSIRSALYELDNVEVARVYENDKDYTDDTGRPPHSIEAVVLGGEDDEIANTIRLKKTSGIYSFGSTRRPVTDSEGNVHDIGFNRPENVYVWLRVELTAMDGTVLPLSYQAITQNIIMDNTGDFGIGEFIILQRLYSAIYNGISNVVNISIKAWTTKDPGGQPSSYTLNNIALGVREIAAWDKGRIEVVEV